MGEKTEESAKQEKKKTRQDNMKTPCSRLTVGSSKRVKEVSEG